MKVAGIVTDPEELTWNCELVPTENKAKGLTVPIPTLPPFLIVMAAELLGAKIKSPVEALPNCNGFMAVAPMVLVVPAALPREKVPAMEATGIPLLIFKTANLAEVVACPPIRKSTVELSGEIAPAVWFQYRSPTPVPQDPQAAVAPPNRH